MSRSRRSNVTGSEYNELQGLEISYEEQFGDLLGILLSGDLSYFGTLKASGNANRDWTKEPDLPWEDKRHPESDFGHSHFTQYNRMAEYRRVLLKDYKDQLLGKPNDRLTIAKTVLDVKAEVNLLTTMIEI